MFRGTVIAQIIAVLVGVYLAKLYGEKAYGYLGVFLSIIAITSAIATLQLDKCIVISKQEEESKNWFNFNLLLIPVTIFLCFLIFFFLSGLFPLKQLTTTIFCLTFFGSIIVTYNLINESYFTYRKQFLVISNTKIITTICNVIFQFGMYYYYHNIGLIIGYLLSQIILLIYCFYKNRKSITRVNFNDIKKGIKENKTIIKYLLPSNTINTIANHLMPILILAFFNAEKAGVYFFSIKLLGVPLFLISSSISQVYFQKSSELINKNKSELLKITKKIISSNILIMILFLVAINTLGTYFLNLYFENKWENLNTYIFILSFLILARSCFNPISSLIVVLNKNLIGLYFNSYLFVVNLIALYFGVINNEIIHTIIILAIFGAIGYVILMFYFLNLLKINSSV